MPKAAISCQVRLDLLFSALRVAQKIVPTDSDLATDDYLIQFDMEPLTPHHSSGNLRVSSTTDNQRVEVCIPAEGGEAFHILLKGSDLNRGLFKARHAQATLTLVTIKRKLRLRVQCGRFEGSYDAFEADETHGLPNGPQMPQRGASISYDGVQFALAFEYLLRSRDPKATHPIANRLIFWKDHLAITDGCQMHLQGNLPVAPFKGAFSAGCTEALQMALEKFNPSQVSFRVSRSRKAVMGCVFYGCANEVSVMLVSDSMDPPNNFETILPWLQTAVCYCGDQQALLGMLREIRREKGTYIDLRTGQTEPTTGTRFLQIRRPVKVDNEPWAWARAVGPADAPEILQRFPVASLVDALQDIGSPVQLYFTEPSKPENAPLCVNGQIEARYALIMPMRP